MTGATQLSACAPEVSLALGALTASRPVGVGPLLGEPPVLAMHEQFIRDVTAIDEELRAPYLAATGDRATDVLRVMYADDLIPRVFTLLDELFGLSVWPTYPDRDVDDLCGPVDALTSAIDALELLGETEDQAVRVRVGQLLGSEMGPVDGIDPEQIRVHYRSDLSGRLKAILAMVDAYVGGAMELPNAVVELVSQQLNEAEVVGTILAVTRHCTLKVDVAQGR